MDKDDATSYNYKEMGEAFGDLIMSKQPPLTFGIMTEHGCTDSFQMSIRARLNRNSTRTRDLKPWALSFLYRLLFFLPSTNHPNFDKKGYIYVRLSSSDYLGTDKVYAGVLNAISLVLERKFGPIPLKVFRAWNHNGRKDLVPYLKRRYYTSILTKKLWKYNPVSYYIWYFVIVLSVSSTVVLWSIYGVPKFTADTQDESFILIALSSIVSVGFVSKLPAMFYAFCHLAVSQSQQIMKWTKGADLKDSLGFMWHIKMELNYINAFLRFMSHLLGRDIHIVLMVDDVSRLGRTPMMKLFEVSSLLSSSRGSRYIQILTMNPLLVAGIVKKQLGYEMSTVIMGPRSFLRNYVNLFVHIQALNLQMKEWYLKHQSSDHVGFIQNAKVHESIEEDFDQYKSNLNLMGLERRQSVLDEENPLIAKLNVKIEKQDDVPCLISNESSVYKQLCAYLTKWNGMLKLITGNQDSIFRIMLGSELTVRLLQLKRGLCGPVPELIIESAIRWSVLVEQWPYRMSWIFLLIRENCERNSIYPDKVELISKKDLLEEILEKAKPVIKVVEASEHFQCYDNLLFLDEDPDTFLMFLRQFSLRVEDMLNSATIRISLDKSIEKILSRCLRSAEDVQENFEASFGPP